MKNPKGKYAWTAKVGEKGQIVIPKEARDLFGIEPGSSVVILGDEDRGLAIMPASYFADLAAMILGAASGENTEDAQDGE